MIKRIKNRNKRAWMRMDGEVALKVIEKVCNEHIPGKYKLEKTGNLIVATSKVSPTVYEWEFEFMNEELLHCLAHSFCAEVIMDELESAKR